MLNASDKADLMAAKKVVMNSPNEPERRSASNDFRHLVASIASKAGDSAECMAILANYGDEPLDGDDCDILIDALENAIQ